MAQEIKAEIKKDVLYLEIPLQDPPTPSKSGKTTVIASTRGNQLTTAQYKGKAVTVGVNAWFKN